MFAVFLYSKTTYVGGSLVYTDDTDKPPCVYTATVACFTALRLLASVWHALIDNRFQCINTKALILKHKHRVTLPLLGVTVVTPAKLD